MTNYVIGTIQISEKSENFSGKSHNIKFVTYLTPKEYELLIEAVNTVSRFLQDSQLFMIAAWNFNEFTELTTNYLQAYSKKDFDSFMQKPINININRVFLNFLSSIRSYLDFMERLLKKRYGEESEVFYNFKKNCKSEYDNNFSYRFLYNLRHYAQHKGLPIGTITWGQKQTLSIPPDKIYYLKICVARDEIILDFDWRALEDEVRALPEEIEILPQVFSFMDSLSRIHARIVSDIFHTLGDSARQIMIFGEKLAGQEGEPVIFEYDGDIRNIQKISHRSLPIKLAQEIVDGEIIDVIKHLY